MIILGYILTVLNYICYCTSRFLKGKRQMLIFDLLAKILTVIALACFGSLTGSVNMIISFLSLIILNIYGKNEESKSRKYTYIIIQAAYIISTIFTYNGISSILILVTSSLSLLSNFWLTPQKMRLVGFFASWLYLIYQMSIKNYAGILELLVIASNLIAYLKYRKIEQK